jgi:CheY-like chemotaxis protein
VRRRNRGERRDAIVQEIVRRQLAPCRVQLVIASDGEEGLMMARAVPPDVVVLDMLMPNMNGEQVLSRMRQDTELANVPVILISNQELDNSLIALGVEDFLLKPIERSSLLRSIGRFVDLARGQSNILIVEDDPMVRDILRRTIKLEGLSVLEARDGIEGLERLGQHPDISLILLDLMMPRMDGFTFLERVREDARHKNIPVVVLTAKTLDEQERELLEASTERVFGKDTMGTGELLSELIHVLKQQDHEGKKGAP